MLKKKEKEKNHVAYLDKETHRALAIMSAHKEISIKQLLKELVKKAEEEQKNV